jgi:hypothetical protein
VTTGTVEVRGESVGIGQWDWRGESRERKEGLLGWEEREESLGRG